MYYYGALTNKSYAFENRPWELNNVNTVDVFDSLGSSITISLYGSEIKRILPLKYDLVNEDWISNRTRYFFEGLYKWRVNIPLVRRKLLGMLFASWTTSFRFFVLNLWYFSVKLKNNAISFILNNAIDYDLIITTKLLCNLMGYSLFRASKWPQINDFYLFYINPNFFKDIKEKSVYLFFGINLRLESPILNIKLRKKLLEEGFIYCNVGSIFNDNLNVLSLGLNIKHLLLLLKGKLPINLYILHLLKKNKICWDFKRFETFNFSILCLLGLNFFCQREGFFFYKYIFDNIKFLNLLNSSQFFNKKKYILWEMICFHNIFKWYSNIYSTPINIHFLNLFSILYEDVILQGVHELVNVLLLRFVYIINGSYPLFKRFKNFVVFQGHHIDIKFLDVNIVFPNMTFLEKTTKFLNLEGFFFKTNKAIGSPYLVRNDWTILYAFYIYFIEFINELYNFDLNLHVLGFLKFNRFFWNSTKSLNKYSVNYFFNEISNFNTTLNFSNFITNLNFSSVHFLTNSLIRVYQNVLYNVKYRSVIINNMEHFADTLNIIDNYSRTNIYLDIFKVLVYVKKSND